MYLGAYIPDCSDPSIRANFETLCSYPPEVIAAICDRAPYLCQTADYSPSIWEPIIGTVEKVVEPFGKIYSGAGDVAKAAGSATLGIGQTALALPQILTLGLIVGGLFLVTEILKVK